MELLILGIDALDARIVKNNIDLFPNMKSLIDKGVFADYRAYAYGYGSNDNWMSIYTGLTPKKDEANKIFKNGFPTIDDYNGHNPLWEMIEKQGKKISLWKLLMISPGKKLKGYTVSGEVDFEIKEYRSRYWDFDPVFIEEEKYLEKYLEKEKLGEPELPKKIEEYGYTWDELKENTALAEKILDTPYFAEGIFEFLKKECDLYSKNIVNINKIRPVDVLFYYTSTLDAFQHFQLYDKSKTAIKQAIRVVDEFIGKLVSELNPKKVIVLSDHGQSSLSEALPNVPEDIQREAFGWTDNSIWLSDGTIVSKARVKSFLSGIHDVNATFIAAGEGIKHKELKDMRTLDIYPTLLEMFDIKVKDDREGYVVDIFKDKKIINKDRFLEEEKIVYKKIAIIQNIDVPKFNNVINEVFLDNRFSEITVFSEEKYAPIFKGNPRVNHIKIMKDRNLSKEDLLEYEEVFIAYRNNMTDDIDYISIK